MLDRHDEEQIQESVNRFIEHALSPELHFRARVGSTALETLPIVAKSPKDVATVLEFLSTVAADPEVDVRCNVLEYIVHIALMLSDSDKSCETLRSFITSHILPIIVTALLDKKAKVVKMADNSLIALLEHCLVPNGYVKERIWPVIIQKMYELPGTDSIIRVITLMSKMVPWVGCDTTETLFVPLFLKFCGHPDMIPRKACASIIGDFCAVVSPNTVENKLVPCFLTLCRDTMWVVRKACAEVFTSVSSAASSTTRKARLTQAFGILLTDPLQHVQSAAFESLGPFITTFAEPSITNLEYNRQGKLVLRHPDGFEYLLNTNIELNMAEQQCTIEDCSKPSLARMIRRELRDSFSNDFSSYLCKEDSIITFESCQNDEKHDYTVLGGDDDEDGLEEQTPSLCDNEESEDKWTCAAVDTSRIDGTDTDLHSDIKTPSFNFEPGGVLKYEEDEIRRAVSLCDIIDTRDKGGGETRSSESVENGDGGPAEPSVSVDCDTNEIDGSVEDEESIDVEDDKDFSGFLYWRDPIPDIDVDVKLGPKPRENTVRIASVRLYSSPQPSTSANLSLSDNDKKTKLDKASENSRKLDNYVMLLKELIEEEIRKKNMEKMKYGGTSGVPDELISHFVSMSSPRQDKTQQNQLAHQCAYNLPAVALTLGPENWALIKQACSSLAADQQWRVRRIVASSIHELAVIVGSDVATEDLVPVFSGFIKDLDEVRIGALKHLANFLKLLKPSGRNEFLPLLAKFLNTDYEWNWRFRAELAEQLLEIIRLFSPCDVSTHLSPVVCTLLQDKVAHVRTIAVQLVVEVIKVIRDEGTLVRTAVAELAEQFAHSSRWSRRQTFAHLCSKLVEEKALPMDMFARDILPHLLDLSWDVVANVRLSVARTLSHHIMTLDTFSNSSSPHHEVVMIVLKRLQSDKDRDVRYFANYSPSSHTLQHDSSSLGDDDESINDMNYSSSKYDPNCSDEGVTKDDQDSISNLISRQSPPREPTLSSKLLSCGDSLTEPDEDSAIDGVTEQVVEGKEEEEEEEVVTELGCCDDESLR